MKLLSLVLLVASLARFAVGQQRHPDDTAKALDEALALVQAGQLSQARQEADEVRGQSPSEGKIQNQLGKVYEKLGDLQRAEEAYQKAIQLEPETEGYYLDLTSLLFLQERPREAIVLLTKAVQRQPQSSSLRLSLGTAYQAAGDKRKALQIFEEESKKTPNLATAYVLYGKLASSLGQTTEAIEALRKATMIDPMDARARYYLGVALRLSNKPRLQSLAEFRKAVEIDPTYAQARYELAKDLESEGRLNEAASEYQQALKDDPTQVQILYRLYWVFNRLGNKEKAQGALEAFQAQRASEHVRKRVLLPH